MSDLLTLLDRLDATVSAMTEGPWRRDARKHGTGCKYVVAGDDTLIADCPDRRDSAGIATLRNVAAELLAVARAAAIQNAWQLEHAVYDIYHADKVDIALNNLEAALRKEMKDV